MSVFGLYIGKTKQYKNFDSAIAKTHQKKIIVSGGHIVGDERAFESHGGKDRAIHQFPSENCNFLRDFYTKTDFKPGFFGENISSIGMTENTVCIGDTYLIGKEVMVQVTCPRDPCFKLNKRFNLTTLAARMELAGCTGWFYRVITDGVIKQGDKIKLLTRPHPNLTVKTVSKVLTPNVHIPKDIINELLSCVYLAEKWKEMLRIRDTRLGKLRRNSRLGLTKESTFVFPEITHQTLVTLVWLICILLTVMIIQS